MEVPPSHKLQGTVYEQQNPYELKEDDSSQRNYKKQLSVPTLPHIKQEYQEIHNKQNKNGDLLYSNIDKADLQSVV